jgi:hypothetical protein
MTIPPALAASVPVLGHAVYSYLIMASQIFGAPRHIRDTLTRHGIASTATAMPAPVTTPLPSNNNTLPIEPKSSMVGHTPSA